MVKRIQKTPFEMLTPSTTSTLSPYNKPIATVKPGEEVEIETWDAFGGCVKHGQTRVEATERGIKVPVNPITGPIYVEDAEPGDSLTVEIIGIDLPGSGATTPGADHHLAVRHTLGHHCAGDGVHRGL
jgi:acetamidase/formamidase